MTNEQVKNMLNDWYGKNRFLFYPGCVWTTAYARIAVWSVISNLKDDYIYCDTDSVKYFLSYRQDGGESEDKE